MDFNEQNLVEIKRHKKKKRRLARLVLKTTLITVLIAVIIALSFGIFYFYNHAENSLLKDEVIADQIEKAEAEEALTIVLDAGHGGKDQGTSYENLLEKDINLSVVQKLEFLLNKAGYNVILTRNTDEFVELPERAAISNNSKADLFISIHCNYNEDSTKIKGLECHYYGSGQGQEDAKQIIDSLEANTTLKTRGTIESDFHVLRNTNAPAVLIELGYLSNSSDRASLQDSAYIKDLCQVLAAAIASAASQD